jgi:CRISPR-associated protein Cmr2
MPHLLMVNVGPVQDFIRTARRSRDLWFSSWLLSELAKAAAQAIQNAHGELIFPCPLDDYTLDANSSFMAANIIVAVIDQPPGDVGVQVRTAIRDRLAAVWKVAKIQGSFDTETAQTQINDLPECVWVAVPLDDPPDADAYTTARSTAMATLAARKATRTFEPVTWGSDQPKSSLDGVRESVLPEHMFPRRDDDKEQRQQKINTLFTNYGASPAERMSGVDLLKRRGQRGGQDRFFSTSHVAALPLLQRFRHEHKPAVEHYVSELRRLGASEDAFTTTPGNAHPAFGHYDGHVLYESRLVDFFDDQAHEKIRAAQCALSNLLHTVTRDKRPSPYYALLHADGDGMGKVIDNQRGMDKHQHLSQTLATFADKARNIVEANAGSLVYAGGDDVLAFVPLHTVVQCAQELATTFATTMHEFEDEKQRRPTLSVGVAITHHIEPLSDALELVREAERRAKQQDGKNALAIMVSKRSGTTRTVVGHWDTIDTRLETLINLCREDAVPAGAAYELEQLVDTLGIDRSFAFAPELHQAARFEAIRILKRKRMQNQELAKDAFAELEPLINQQSVPIAALANELIVAQLLADARNLAEPSQAEKE